MKKRSSNIFTPRDPFLWRVTCLVLGLIIVIPLAGQPTHESMATGDLRDEMRRLILTARDRVFPALVHIEATTVRYGDGREIKGRSGGSGAIISDDGFVVTNHHVIEEGSGFVCTLADQRRVEARLVGSDPLTDLAVLQLQLDQLQEGLQIQPAAFGDSSTLEIGDYVLAMGSPFTLSRSVSLGIVSNTARVFGPGVGGGDLGGIELDLGQRTGLFTRWIQHDAALNPGNSGGPLVDLEGKVVGINQLGGDQVGFAIPADLARGVVDALIQTGRVPRSWIGISFKPLDGTEVEDGVLVHSLVVNGPAARAGLEVGDVLLSIEGEPLRVQHLEQVPSLLADIAAHPVGSSLEMSFIRPSADSEVTGKVDVTTEDWPQDRGNRRALKAWGATVQGLTPKTAADLQLPTSEGVLVTGVRPGGPAALADPPIERGDVLLEVQGRAAAKLDDLLELYEDARAPDQAAGKILLTLERRGQNLLSVLTPRKDVWSPRPSKELSKPWLGVATQPLTENLAELLGMPQVRGFRITRVYHGTEAEAVGLQAGDILLRVGDRALAPRGRRDSDLLRRVIRARAIGEMVELEILRGDRQMQLEVELGAERAPSLASSRLHSSPLEMTVREVTFSDRDNHRWDPSISGVLIDEMESAGRARLAGLRPNDLIQILDSTPVEDLDGFERALEGLSREKPETVRVIIRRGSRTFLNVLRPDW